ncbi:MAG: hypothetical protein CBC53_000725 [Alphaproteobacteria bacterium TMED93]|nr:MAG: hypothetical protein CBC53_000725 [Alphaproteobacteria bacterium TMED93]|tara:strand:- start:1161 stop:1565 length:405 start_codon:yes stop_codon:yes gene_type:complete
MVTLGDAILAINPDAVFEYEDIDTISWQRRTKPINKEEILSKYKELKDLEKERIALEKANRKGFLGKVIAFLDDNKIIVYNYRQPLATFSIVISLVFVLTENFHKVRYTILTDPYGTEFVYDRFTGKIKKKINY